MGGGGEEDVSERQVHFHSVRQLRVVKAISTKFEELAMIWPKIDQTLAPDLVRDFRTVSHSLCCW